jgi:dynein heavy chain
MLYFLLIQLCVIDNMYQYSLESFTTFFFKAIEKTEEFDEEEPRVLALRQMIRMTIYQWVSRGLFEQHKAIFLAQLTFRLMAKRIVDVEYTQQQMNFLINCPTSTAVPNPLKRWLPDAAWYSVQKLIDIELFESFATNLAKDAPKRFEDWYNEQYPEVRTLPLDWRSLDQTPFQKLLVVRCLRPDRCNVALSNFIRGSLPAGDAFVDCDSTSSSVQVLQSAFGDSTNTTPVFFILSPGANPVKDVEALARHQGMDPNKQLHQVALGQGQDVVASQKLDLAHKEGHWVMLQNVHLMPEYLRELEKKLAQFALEGSDPQFRLFLSSDPAKPDAVTGQDVIPIGLLEKSIKLTNEPPAGLKANMKRAFTFFIKEEFEDKDSKVKTILFALCYFHSMMLERKKFGSKGFNMQYPFSIGDLRDSAIVLQNYLDANAGSGKVPWPDLIYIFGDIMYGGHIVNNWDRVFCTAFLENLMQDSLLDEANMFPFTDGTPVQFKAPAPTTYEKYIEYIDLELPPESPVAFGMHPNAEIDYRSQQCKTLFAVLVELQPKDAGAGGDGGDTVQSKVAEFASRVADEASLESNRINVEDITSKLTDETRGPYQNVFIQECEQLNVLLNAILRSLAEIELANKGELTMTEQMEAVMTDVFLNKVPVAWAKVSFETTRGLGAWLDSIKQRLEQLNAWKEVPDKEPAVTFINRLYNPASFLTAVKQVMSREKSIELNRLYIATEIQKKMYWEAAELQKREGAFVFGLQVEGARWDPNAGLEECEPKKQFSVVPVVLVRPVVLQEGKEEKGVYQCPVYKTELRGNTYVFTAQLKTKHPPTKWTLAGAALILDVEGVSDAFAFGKEPAQ